MCLNTSYDQVFTRISVPTIIIWGENDWIYPLEIAYKFKKHIPHAVLKIVPGNHDWLIYNPLQFPDIML